MKKAVDLSLAQPKQEKWFQNHMATVMAMKKDGTLTEERMLLSYLAHAPTNITDTYGGASK